ncbi:alpha/beta fold hydrolase [Leptospira yasudae]|uniref:alpha/beta fold hydrolase n=1 Tax=Leptospira yasudae TaxID=2202201 RepID=UPI001091598D|nr:alpha/beta hydrolase [Leptospira yasudae]TGN01337.1 alpha/beta hydrolase [Leptospira yasudae]
MKRITIAVLSLSVFILLALPFLADGENGVIDAEVRARSGGSFAQGRDGSIHYQFEGPENGEIVVLVHGLSMPLFIYGPISTVLQREGFRVLRMDLYGRGLSDRPETPYNNDLYERQLSDLFQSLNIQKPVHLIGTSMGALVTIHFTLKYPEKVKTLGLIAPAGLPMEIPLVAKLSRLPILGDYMMKSFGDRSLLQGTKKSFYEPENFPDFGSLFQEQMQYKGFKRAILSSLRNMPLESFEEEYKRLGTFKIPKLLIWGKEDKVVPFKNSELALQLLPGIEFVPLDNAGHIPHYEIPERVAPKLVEFLKR